MLLGDSNGPTSVPVLQLRNIELVSLQTHLASSGPDSSSTCTTLLELKAQLPDFLQRISQLAWPWPMALVKYHALVRFGSDSR